MLLVPAEVSGIAGAAASFPKTGQRLRPHLHGCLVFTSSFVAEPRTEFSFRLRSFKIHN